MPDVIIHDAESGDATVVAPVPGRVVLEDQDAGANEIVVIDPPVTPRGIVLGVPGRPGEPGPKGDPGDVGPMPDLSTLAHTHVQGTPSAVWLIEHPISFVPNLTVVDSAGMVVEGDVEYLGPTTIRVTFSGAFSGTAYLS